MKNKLLAAYDRFWDWFDHLPLNEDVKGLMIAIGGWLPFGAFLTWLSVWIVSH